MLNNKEEKEFYANGNIKKEILYQKKSDSWILKEYFDNGVTKRTSIYNRNLLKHGIYKEYYKEGNLKAKIPFVQGRKQGVAKIYFKNGNVSISISYVDNNYNGTIKIYYESGELKIAADYLDNVLHGKADIYSKDGTIVKTQTFQNGVNNTSSIHIVSGVPKKDFYKNRKDSNGKYYTRNKDKIKIINNKTELSI